MALPVLLAFLLVLIACPTRPAAAQSPTALSGTWVLDRESSQLPREIGFGTIAAPFSDGDDARGGRPRGRRDGGGGSLQPALRPGGESYDEGRRRQLLTDEVRTPPARLTIVDTPTAVTITDERGTVRTFHPGTGAEALPLENVTVLTIATREDGKLIVLYSVADLRQIRYTFSRALGGGPLMVDVQLLERGSGDSVRRIYKPEAPAATAASSSSGTTAPSAADNRGRASMPAAGSGAPAPLPRNGSEYAGLARMGLVIEDLGPQAAACGLKREALQAAVTTAFADSGVRMVADADDDTYLYVRVMTSPMSGGTCVSRFDWTIYSATEGTLSHQRSPLLLQVELARRGGLAGGPATSHGADVVQQLTRSLTDIVATIRGATRPGR